MAAAKKATSSTNKDTGATIEEIKSRLAPCAGYYVVEEGGHKIIHYVCSGLPLPSDYIFFGSQEEACSIAGEPFYPVGLSSFSERTQAEFAERHERIFDSIVSIDNSALKVAFDLHWVNKKKAYRIKNFPTIADYAKFYFGYEKTSCYALISVVDRFAKRDDDGNILEEIDPAYSAYTTSKLSLMVNLTDDQINQRLKPAMSVREIKKVVKSLEEELPDHSKDTGNKKEDLVRQIDAVLDSTVKEITRNTLFSYKGAKDYGKKFNAEKVKDQVSNILKDHPDALIEISYILP